MSLTALSPEVIGCVVGNIESQPTLYNLTQCSHQLYLSTIPHLYRHVTVQEGLNYGKQHNGKLQKLPSLLLRRPDLVRYFTVQDGLEADGWLDECECENIPVLYRSDEKLRSIPIKVDRTLKTASFDRQ